jgi:2'-5' RNA ligase
MSRIRTFIAVEIGDEIRKRAVALQERLAKTGDDVRWVDPAGMHVTLIFLGEVDEREVMDVCRAVKAVAKQEAPFTLNVSGVGAFPNTRRPKTVWAGITDGAEALQRIHGLLNEALSELGGYRKEDRAYTPHLTLGRVNGSGQGLIVEFPKLMSWSGGHTTVNELIVFSSEMTREGPEYTPLGRGVLARENSQGVK